MLASVKASAKPDDLRRVLLTTDAIGGVWQYTLDLARCYCRDGLGVDLVVAGPEPSAIRKAEAASIPGLSLILSQLPLEWMAKEPAAMEEAAQQFAILASSLKPDVIHLSNPALACSVRFSCPLIVTLHSCVPSWWTVVKGDVSMPENFRWQQGVIDAGLRAADAVITPTTAFADTATAIYPEVRFYVVHNGRDPLPHVSPQHQMRHGVFTSGRFWDEGKNARTLDQAAKKCRLPINAAGAVVGPSGEGVPLHHLRLLGDLPNLEVRHWLLTSEIYVSVSRYEPFGLGVLEAAQAGCSLILSDIPTFRELWDGAACFVAPGDANALADMITELNGNNNVRHLLAKKASARAERLTATNMAAATREIYDSASRYRRPFSKAARI